jgi:DNA-binding CsgD family transcriptional regulator
MARSNPVALVVAAYVLAGPQRQWLESLAQGARRAFALPNIGAYAVTYDASDITACSFGELGSAGIESPDLLDYLRRDVPAAYRLEPAVVDAVFRKTPYGPSRRLPLAGRVDGVRRGLARLGAVDILGLNGINVDGRGVHVGVLLPQPVPRGVQGELLARISSHLAAAFRLRASVSSGAAIERAEAVLDASGAVEHATGVARLREARQALSAAAVRIERLRGVAGERDPARAVAQWRALVDARWSLVDHFERDGKRYLLAQRNDPAVAPFALLTTRERQVVALAALGHANKMIGYELGISVSTAGVLLSRAARKLGVRTRAALVAAYEKHVADTRAARPERSPPRPPRSSRR